MNIQPGDYVKLKDSLGLGEARAVGEESVRKLEGATLKVRQVENGGADLVLYAKEVGLHDSWHVSPTTVERKANMGKENMETQNATQQPYLFEYRNYIVILQGHKRFKKGQVFTTDTDGRIDSDNEISIRNPSGDGFVNADKVAFCDAEGNPFIIHKAESPAPRKCKVYFPEDHDCRQLAGTVKNVRAATSNKFWIENYSRDFAKHEVVLVEGSWDNVQHRC